MNALKIQNPYEVRKGKWIKGNLHTHSNRSDCGRVNLEKVFELYKEHKYDFIALTDHDIVTEADEKYGDLVVIKGYEASKYSHILCINTEDISEGNTQEIINNTMSQGGISILCHPNWKKWDYWAVEEMMELEGYTGIEVYNSVINRLVGSSEAFQEWDFLLSEGKKVWGFANDDFHFVEDINKAWNVVRVEEMNKENIIDSIKDGNFYISTGVQIYDIYIKNNKIIIETDADKLRFISQGRVISEVLSSKAIYDIKDFSGYLRVEAINEDGTMAWSQPLFKL
ncbi:MAG: CehA/McbA family metallohydrolase [Halanaerobiaceae bacterium]